MGSVNHTSGSLLTHSSGKPDFANGDTRSLSLGPDLPVLGVSPTQTKASKYLGHDVQMFWRSLDVSDGPLSFGGKTMI